MHIKVSIVLISNDLIGLEHA